MEFKKIFNEQVKKDYEDTQEMIESFLGDLNNFPNKKDALILVYLARISNALEALVEKP